jgi:hypothetical protein
VEKDRQVGDVGWEKKSELGDGCWAVRPRFASVFIRVTSLFFVVVIAFVCLPRRRRGGCARRCWMPAGSRLRGTGAATT